MSKGRLSVVLLALAQLTCDKSFLFAPPGSTITLVANPTFIEANGGVSVITALVIEPAGTPVSDGTLIFFFTNLGRIDERATTRNGLARANLVSDSRSGTARVFAFAGGGTAPGAGESPTPTTSPTSTTVTQAPAGTSGPLFSQPVDVVIGSARPTRVQVTAVPNRITESRSTHVFANVFDGSGNPVANVPVIFTVTATPLDELMDSGGSPIFTDTNGRAEDVMRTRRDRGDTQKTATVTATTANGITGSFTVTIN